MATNRDKINKMNNEEFAEKILELGNKDILKLGYRDRRNNIMRWLSQEAQETEEEKDIIILPMPEDENTRKVIEYIIPRLTLLSARLDTLEKKTFNAISDEEYKRVYKRYGEDLMKDFYRLEEDTTEKEKTADEMFEEQGYEIGDAEDGLAYYVKDEGFDEDTNTTCYSKISIEKDFSYWKCDVDGFGTNITEAEDKAIHKKINELKEEN